MKKQIELKWYHGAILFVVALLVQLIAVGVISVVAIALSATDDGSSQDLLAALFSPAGIVLQVGLISSIFATLALAAPKLLGHRIGPTLYMSAARPGVYLSAAVGVLAVGILSDQVTHFVHTTWPHIFDSHALDQLAKSFLTASPAGWAAMAIAVTVGPGIAEELLFRGFLLRSFRGSMPAWLAVALSSVLFGVMHLNALQAVGTIVIGFYLGFLVVASGSIWPAIWAHALNNLLVSIVARFDYEGSGQALVEGHPPYVLAAAAAVAAGTILWTRHLNKHTSGSA